jgi:hypothetical protein
MKQREQTIPPSSMVRLSETAHRLVQLCDATGKTEEAVRWHQEQEWYAGKVVGHVHEVGQGLELRGQLDKQNPILVYQVKLAAGNTYVIDMVSPDQIALDPNLVLTEATGKKLAEGRRQRRRPQRPHHLPRRTGRPLPDPGDHHQRRRRRFHPDRARKGEFAERGEEITHRSNQTEETTIRPSESEPMFGWMPR